MIHHDDDLPAVGPWTRFWARQFDTFGVLLALTFTAAIVAPTSLVAENAGLAFGFVAVVAWIPIESILLTSWGTTPGKALLDVHVFRADGRPLGLRAACSRSLRACLLGMAAGLPLVSLLTMSLSYQRLTETGSTSWDEDLGLRVRVAPMTPARFAFALACGAALLVAIAATQAMALSRVGDVATRSVGLAR